MIALSLINEIKAYSFQSDQSLCFSYTSSTLLRGKITVGSVLNT